MGNGTKFEGGFEASRRADDQAEPLSPAHQVIYDRIGQVKEELEAHMRSPIHIPDRDDYTKLIETTDRIVDALEGTRFTTIDGQVQHRSTEGIIYVTKDTGKRVEQLEAKLDTGVEARLSPKERATIMAAAIGGSLALVGTIVDALLRAH